MNGPPRKRRHYGVDHTAPAATYAVPTPTKRARPRPTSPLPARGATGNRCHRPDAFGRRPVAARAESEEIEEDEHVGTPVAPVRCAPVAAQATADVDAIGSDSDSGDDPAMPLVVFQCSTCRSIFGDSYAFVCSTEQLWLVTLSHVTHVALDQHVQTAGTGLDAGSSYHELLCQNCQAVLGRKYLTTPVALDGIRDLFSFSTEAITSYALGDPMQSSDEGAVDRQRAAAACQSSLLTLAADRSELVRLREEMEKVKGLMVTVDDRLACLEGAEPESEEEAARQQSLPPRP